MSLIIVKAWNKVQRNKREMNKQKEHVLSVREKKSNECSHPHSGLPASPPSRYWPLRRRSRPIATTPAMVGEAGKLDWRYEHSDGQYVFFFIVSGIVSIGRGRRRRSTVANNDNKMVGKLID